MSTFIQLLLRSFETGAIYALAALGIIIVYRTNRMVNFAQGTMGMFGAFIITALHVKLQLPITVSIFLGLIGAVLVGFLADFLIVRRTKHVTGAGKEIITLGMLMVFLGITPMIFGVDPMKLDRVVSNGSLTIAGAHLSLNSLLNIIIGLGCTIALFFLLQRTNLGLAIRVTASNEEVARLMGIKTESVTLFAWAAALTLGALSGALIAPSTSVTVNLMDAVQIAALIACVLGGFQTFYGAVIGAYIIAIGGNMLSYYVSSVWGNQILYILIILIVVIKPMGLFGKKMVKKV